MNHCIIIGGLVVDPEAYTTQNGVARSSFRVAVQRRFRNAQGEREADFLTVVAWRQTAEFCNRYLKKGAKVAIEGSIQTRSYDAQDGSKRYVTEIIAENVESLTRADGGDRGEQKPRANANEPAASSMPSGFTPVDEDSELPF
ncbi:MAG: single-stranded DNA-binding protein [Bacteroidales bacterium]|nr:single-stranded DNA-binding protein [Bacteroidales bacterium]